MTCSEIDATAPTAAATFLGNLGYVAPPDDAYLGCPCSASLRRPILGFSRFRPFLTDTLVRVSDLAAAETGRIPPEILENEDLMEKLPVLFRALRGQKVPDEQLDELVRTIRKV